MLSEMGGGEKKERRRRRRKERVIFAFGQLRRGRLPSTLSSNPSSLSLLLSSPLNIPWRHFAITTAGGRGTTPFSDLARRGVGTGWSTKNKSFFPTGFTKLNISPREYTCTKEFRCLFGAERK